MKEKYSRAQLHDDQIITVLVPNNPKQPGSAAHHMFGLYRNGMTVGEFVAAVQRTSGDRVKLGLPPQYYIGMRGVRWDLAHRFIRVDEPPQRSPFEVAKAQLKFLRALVINLVDGFGEAWASQDRTKIAAVRNAALEVERQAAIVANSIQSVQSELRR
jgi:hypothetical protein